jgi:hypothetical protein
MNKELVICKIYDVCRDYNLLQEKLSEHPLAVEEYVSKESTIIQLEELFTKLTLIEAEEKAMLEGVKEQMAHLEVRKKRAENTLSNLRSTFMTAMRLWDIEKIKCPVATISRGTSAPKIIIDDEALFQAQHPEYYIDQDPKLDKQMLKDDITKYGLAIEGVRLEQSETVIIRRK